MKLSLKKLLTLFLTTAIFSILLLSFFSLYFNHKLVNNQEQLLDITKIYLSRQEMQNALSSFFSRQQNFLLSNDLNDLEDLKNIMLTKELETQFTNGLNSLRQLAETYPDVNHVVKKLQLQSQQFLLTDKQLLILVKEKFLSQLVLNKKIQMLKPLLIDFRKKTTLLVGKLEAHPDKMTQENIKNLNNALSEFPFLLWQTISSPSQDNLGNLNASELVQSMNLIDSELKNLNKTSSAEINQSILEIENQFQVIRQQILDNPNDNLLNLLSLILEWNLKINNAIDALQKTQGKMVSEFNELNTLVTHLKNNSLLHSEKIIFQSKIIMTIIVSCVVLFLIGIGTYLLHVISASFNSLITTMKNMVDEKVNFSNRVKKIPFSDLNEVGVSFNSMTDKVQFLYSHMESLVDEKTIALSKANHALEIDLQKRIEMEKTVESLNKNLVVAARQAGMADVATSVLHNVGNALNSIIVSLSVLGDHFQHNDFKKLLAVSTMLESNLPNLIVYLTEDEKGKLIPAYLIALIKSIYTKYELSASEITLINTHIKHIESIISMQQNVSGTKLISETVFLPDVVETAIQMAGITDDILIEKQFIANPSILTDKSKLIQILLNLILNAKDALIENSTNNAKKTITIQITEMHDQVQIAVTDNGIGIEQKNLDNIFAFGFTTKTKGHGFGLHGSALTAKELGGNLQVSSKGLGTGSTFTLTLPISLETKK